MESNYFSRSFRSNTFTNNYSDNHKNENDNDYDPCSVDLPDPVLWESLWGWPRPEGSLQAWNQLTTLELGNIWQSLFFGILGLLLQVEPLLFSLRTILPGLGYDLLWPQIPKHAAWRVGQNLQCQQCFPWMKLWYFRRFRPLILSVLRRIPYSLPGLPNDEVGFAMIIMIITK